MTPDLHDFLMMGVGVLATVTISLVTALILLNVYRLQDLTKDR